MSTNDKDMATSEHDTCSTRPLRSWIVKMAPLKKFRNRLGLGNHMIMAMQTQATKITIDVENLTRASLEATTAPDTACIGVNDIVELQDDERVLLRVWQRKEKGFSKLHNEEWIEQGTYRLEEVTVDRVNGNTVKVQFGFGHALASRQVRFKTEADARTFQTTHETLARLEKDYGKRQLEKYRSSGGSLSSLKDTDRIKLLIEIVSITYMNEHVEPSVVITMGGKVLHRTGHASSNTGSAIYALEDGCFFLLNTSLLEFFSSGGIAFGVKDQDSIARMGDMVGRVTVPLERILNATGERDSYQIVATNSKSQQIDNHSPGKLCIRVRRASADDTRFMSAYRTASNAEGVFLEETFLPVRPPPGRDMLRVQHKPVRRGENKHRVKPFPDPERPEETTWMTRTQMEQEAMHTSTHWVEAGSGTIGRVYFEVISCEGLPNMDLWNPTPQIAPDTFACLVFEDSIVNTDVITNSRSPRWVPWCRRAFAFNLSHPSSNIFLGLFDWDQESSPVQAAMTFASDVHDPIARIMVNVADAHPDTEYTLTYPLYYGKSVEHRQKARGTITVRLRKEIFDNRKAALAGAKLPRQNYISVATENEFSVAHYTTEGGLNEEAYSLNKFTQYIEEIESYQVILDYIKAAALSLLFWRGHYEVTIWTKKAWIPLNSLLAFSWGILVTNNFDRFPAFCLFSVGWIMLVCNEQARQAPSPWHKARSYPPLLKAVLFGSDVHGEAIAVNEGADAMEIYNKQLEEKAQRRKREKEVEAEYLRKLKEELGLSEYDEDEQIVSRKQRLTDSITINPLILPFKSTLYPIQKELRSRVLLLRIARNVVTWQDKVYSFWITNMAFVAALACFWVPWALILKWILRIAVWALLGPWTAIVARYRFPIVADMTDEEWNEAVQKRIQMKHRKAIEASTKIQARKERVVKGKALARWMFGRYHLRVPRFNEQLFPDIPLPCSFSKPLFDSSTCQNIQIKERVYGQDLEGDMIPRREVQVDPSRVLSARDSVFIDAGLENYFDDAYGWASFVNVTKITYMIGYGIAKGRVYAKTSSEAAQLVGYSTLRMASAGWGMGTSLTSEIIFFKDEDAYKRFSKGNYEIEGGAKAHISKISADFTAGTTGIPLLARVKKDDGNPRYRNGMAMFVLSPKVGMMADLSVVGQKFTFDAI